MSLTIARRRACRPWRQRGTLPGYLVPRQLGLRPDSGGLHRGSAMLVRSTETVFPSPLVIRLPGTEAVSGICSDGCAGGGRGMLRRRERKAGVCGREHT